MIWKISYSIAAMLTYNNTCLIATTLLSIHFPFTNFADYRYIFETKVELICESALTRIFKLFPANIWILKFRFSKKEAIKIITLKFKDIQKPIGVSYLSTHFDSKNQASSQIGTTLDISVKICIKSWGYGLLLF